MKKLYLDDGLHRKLKAIAGEEGITLYNLTENMIREYLKKWQTQLLKPVGLGFRILYGLNHYMVEDIIHHQGEIKDSTIFGSIFFFL